jgi:hypothetical protein
MGEPVQQKLNFPVVFTDEEWGKHEMSEETRDRIEKMPEDMREQFRRLEKHLYIFNPEISKRLPQHIIGQVSKVQCPFCNEGYLKLVKIEPRHSGGLRGNFGTQEHVGNDYRYGCTDENCGATFFYSCTWCHLD